MYGKYYPAHYELIEGMDAAFSHSADKVEIWPADARQMALETYKAIKDFLAACKCKIDCKIDGPAMDDTDVEQQMNNKFPGENKVEWDLNKYYPQIKTKPQKPMCGNMPNLNPQPRKPDIPLLVGAVK